MARSLHTARLALALVALIPAAWADLVVDWGGNYVAANQAFSSGTTAGFGGFSAGDPLQISPTTGYSGGAFYGQVAWTTTGSDGNYATVVNNTSLDRLEIKRYSTDIKALVLWRQADFLNGMNSGTVAFDNTSSVSMNLNTLVNFDAGRVVIRLEGGAQDGYYISQESPFNGTGLKSAQLTSLTWLAYDPATSLTTFNSPTSLLADGMITNVTEIGFYTRSNNAANPNAFRLDSFEVSAITVPEPAALTLVGLGALTLLARRRKTAA